MEDYISSLGNTTTALWNRLSQTAQEFFFNNQLTLNEIKMTTDPDLTSNFFSLKDIIVVRLIRQEESQKTPTGTKIPDDLTQWSPDTTTTRARVFLRDFTTDLEVAGIPQARWPTALVKACKGTARTWARRVIFNKVTDWAAAQQLFMLEFHHADEALELRSELAEITQGPTETVRQYGERFLDLLSNLGDDPTHQQTLYLFQRGLRESIQGLYSTSNALNPIEHINMAIRVATTLENATTTRKTKVKAISRVKERLICVNHPNSTTHATKDCLMGKELICDNCPHLRNHLTKDCRKKVIVKDSQPSLNISNPTLTSSSSPSSSSTSSSSTLETRICYKCRQPGHMANTCPNVRTSLLDVQNSGVQEDTRIEWMLDVTSDSESILISNESGQELEAEASSLSSNNVTSFMCLIGGDEFNTPISLNGHDVLAMIDTGSSHSFIHSELALTLNLSANPVEGSVILASTSSTSSRRQTEDLVTVIAGERVIRHRFEVMTLNFGVQVLIGRDLFMKLGFSLEGIPYAKPTFASEHADNATPDEEEAPSPMKDAEPSPFKGQLEDAIHGDLERNRQIKGFCTVPGSMVHLPTEDGSSVFIRQYRIPQAYINDVTETVEKWLSDGTTELIDYSPWNNPLTISIKKNPLTGRKDEGSKIRVCVDTRALNKKLVAKNPFHIPMIAEILEGIGGAVIFSALDITGAFHSLEVASEDRFKTAFRWNSRTYQFRGAPFGIHFITEQFQATMNRVLGRMSKFVMFFVDDVIIFSKSYEEHLQHCKEVINTLTEAGFKLNKDKCNFGYNSLHLLGHYISRSGTQIDYRKLQGMDDWQQPTAQTIESYLGLFNYFRSFIPYYSNVVAPLDRVRKQFEWNQEQQEAWETMKTLLVNAPIIHYPDFKKRFYVATDGSRRGISATLFQLQDGNEDDLDETLFIPHGQKQRHSYISFQSRALSATEKRYSATKIEMLAVSFALIRFRHYLLGRKFVLYTDHRALVWLFNDKELNRVTNTWLELVLEYNFSVKHLPGLMNVLPDVLSRIYPSNIRGDEDDDNHKRLSASCSEPFSIPMTSDRRTKTLRCATSSDTTDARCSTVTIQEDPATQENQIKIQHEFGHFGAHAIVKTLKSQGYTWPNMLQQALRITNECVECQRHNVARMGFHPLRTINAQMPFDHVAVDLIGPLPLTPDGYNYILTLIDIFTRFTIIRPLQTKSALETAQTLFSIISDFGIFKIIQSDNGKEFCNEIITELKSLTGFEHRFTTPYHPRANGAVERMNGTVTSTIKKMIKGEVTAWKEYLPIVQLAINNKICERTGSSSFALLFGRASNQFIDYAGAETIGNPMQQEQWKKITEMVYPGIRLRIEERSKRMTSKFNSKRTIIEKIPIGSRVMTVDELRSSKFAPRYEGPFTIVECTSGGSYRLTDTDGALMSRSFAPSQLKVISAPNSDDNDDKDVYVVEKIVDHRGSKLNQEYLVKWKGFDSSKNTWEPYSNFIDTDTIIQYWRKKGKK